MKWLRWLVLFLGVLSMVGILMQERMVASGTDFSVVSPDLVALGPLLVTLFFAMWLLAWIWALVQLLRRRGTWLLALWGTASLVIATGLFFCTIYVGASYERRFTDFCDGRYDRFAADPASLGRLELLSTRVECLVGGRYWDWCQSKHCRCGPEGLFGELFEGCEPGFRNFFLGR
jgi:hypothetical protein